MNMTCGWILYRIIRGKPQFFGIYESEDAARRDGDLIALPPKDVPWIVECQPFRGWGKVLFSTNEEHRGDYGNAAIN
jgi:hypothetical protein